MSEGQRTRRIVARVIVALLLGIALGYAVGASLASDAARGRALTMKDYIADFDNYKEKLESGSPMAAMIVAGVFMALAAVGIYEGLVWVVDKVLAALDRRRASATTQPGTPPPW
jgi:hypothetical protein